jgi:hypothetical protein
MKASHGLVIVLLFLGFGCSKDSNSLPSISIKSYTSSVYNGGAFNAVLKYNSPNSTNMGDSLVIINHRLNQSVIDTSIFRGEYGTRVAYTQSTNKAEIAVNLDWSLVQTGGPGPVPENDTCIFSFYLVGPSPDFTHSDTASTGTVVIYQ